MKGQQEKGGERRRSSTRGLQQLRPTSRKKQGTRSYPVQRTGPFTIENPNKTLSRRVSKGISSVLLTLFSDKKKPRRTAATNETDRTRATEEAPPPQPPPPPYLAVDRSHSVALEAARVQVQARQGLVPHEARGHERVIHAPPLGAPSSRLPSALWPLLVLLLLLLLLLPLLLVFLQLAQGLRRVA